MLSSIFLHSTVISFLLTLNLCFANSPGAMGPPPSPSGPPPSPSGPSNGPLGYECNFAPPSSVCSLNTNSPTYNQCQISGYSVTEFIQCANETSTLTDNNGHSEAFNNVLGVLVSAVKIPACNRCNSSAFASYQAMGDKSQKLANYLCGKLDNHDICCLSMCLDITQPEHSLAGICKNDNVNLWGNDVICDGSSDSSNNQAAASSSSTVANAPTPTVTPSPSPPTSSSIAAQTTAPTQSTTTTSAQTPTSSPAGTSGSSAGSSISAVNVMALGVLVVFLTAGMGGAL
ncbi:hypothetical protein BDR22DRAFT_852064 [Usnea florida]